MKLSMLDEAFVQGFRRQAQVVKDHNPGNVRLLREIDANTPQHVLIQKALLLKARIGQTDRLEARVRMVNRELTLGARFA
jgi:hypothetical protein